jgi:hypothetical protein
VPSASSTVALWTWAIEAAATGSLKAVNRAGIGLPSSPSTTRIATSCGKGGTRS